MFYIQSLINEEKKKTDEKSSKLSIKTQDKCTIIKTEMMTRISIKMDVYFQFEKKTLLFLF